MREELLGRLAHWVDEVLADEPPPGDIPPERLAGAEREVAESPERAARPDLFSLWSAIVTLTEETRLQGRAFKQLHDRLATTPSLAEEITSLRLAQEESLAALRKAADAAGAAQQQHQQAERQAGREAAWKETIEILLDIRDRLVRGLAVTRDRPPHAGEEPKASWLAKLFGRSAPPRRQGDEVVDALVKGYDLALARLDEHLERLGIAEIECLGRAVDYDTMTAVDVEYTLDVPESEVLAVYRAGYQRHGKVIRPAEVKVARHPDPGPGEGKETNDG